MYIPASFLETRPEFIRSAIQHHPLATLITVGADGIEASHLPLLYDPAENPHGILRGHLARANTQWKTHQTQFEALAIFSGPEHYISPTWYPSLQEHGKVVPTWNYVVVHARGQLRFTDDKAWLLRNVSALTDAQEKSIDPPWRVSDAPPQFIDDMLQAIVGVELRITRLEGKWKVSQNRSLPDRHGVVEGLEKSASPEAHEMATLVNQRIPRPDHS